MPAFFAYLNNHSSLPFVDGLVEVDWWKWVGGSGLVVVGWW